MLRTRVPAALLVLAVAACGTESDGTGDDTGLADATATDTGDVDEGDTNTDADGDETPDGRALVEICDDRIDNDEDGEIDCRDADCDPCPPDEICDDEIDNDGDGDIDGCDTDCLGSGDCWPLENTEALCTDGWDNDWDGLTDEDDPDCARFVDLFSHSACQVRGGECICPPVTPGEDGPFSYINAIAIPPRGTDAECCFDFDHDGDIDNGLSLLVGALGELGVDLDVDALLREALADDSVALVFEWGKGEADAGFWAYLATNDVDGDGEPDQDFADRFAGDGVFQVLPESLDEFGSLAQFNFASNDDSGTNPIVTAGPSLVRLDIPIDTDGLSFDLDLTIENAFMIGEWIEIDTGVASVNPEFDIDGEMVEFGGWELGGVVPIDQIAVLLDDLASDCACADFDTDAPIIAYGDDGTRYNLACAQTPADACTEADGVVCENLSAICSSLPLFPSLGLNDIDTDNNGVGDALSVGIRLSATGATLADPPVAGEE